MLYFLRNPKHSMFRAAIPIAKINIDAFVTYHFHPSFVDDGKGSMANQVFGIVFVYSNGIHNDSLVIFAVSCFYSG